MTVCALIVACLAGAPAPLPERPVERIATKALRGDFGRLEGWQREGYTRLLKGHRTYRAYRTHYGPYEGRQGRVDAYGNPCTMRTLAANRLPRKAYVLLIERGELRQVLDCGARSNDRRFADRRGLDCWIDTWEPHSRLRNVGGPVTIAVTEG
jgi:hypothetical protein